ncbi:hypothetical protein [Providencia rettgeri]|uniref:hypothetical protein n=1 Tax=Providencia rettgeri TaxID=587 RepID=UPI001BA90B78|nr:hypothetical protein [Providencia rettgeri]MBS0861589.1 hypothetical protein [Providencia rettgeri]MBS0875560.1 hypothetical protein [Providencia rettgeri]MBS0922645.1 hypothetical protein [Providencia rettgeri]
MPLPRATSPAYLVESQAFPSGAVGTSPPSPVGTIEPLPVLNETARATHRYSPGNTVYDSTTSHTLVAMPPPIECIS